ncbi:MAG: hypothetical protein JWN31_673 [Frankiales bacterium]|nr:hypothetical protein [Frankiales bacterium]
MDTTSGDEPDGMTSLGAAAERGLASDRRDADADRRDIASDRRDHAAALRDRAGDERDWAAELRDNAASRRDEAGDERDRAALLRDGVADMRDETATARDSLSRKRHDAVEKSTATVSDDADRARHQASEDRSRSAQERRAGADERIHASLDRATAVADRAEGDRERARAELDRESAISDRVAAYRDRLRADLDRTASLGDRSAASDERDFAAFDPLTGVHLRLTGLVLLEQEIARARREAKPLIVAFVDVDHLKRVNDTSGHAAGDVLLVSVAKALRDELRSYDLIVRYGGDEFVCVLPGLSSEDAAVRLTHVNRALAREQPGRSVSFGLAELMPDETPSAVVGRADAALYAKRRASRGE